MVNMATADRPSEELHELISIFSDILKNLHKKLVDFEISLAANYTSR